MNSDTPTWVKAFYTPLVKNQAAAKIVAKTNDGEEAPTLAWVRYQQRRSTNDDCGEAPTAAKPSLQKRGEVIEKSLTFCKQLNIFYFCNSKVVGG
jgi:hypothetical protein